MRKFLCISIIGLVLMGACKKVVYRKDRLTGFGEFRRNVLFYQQNNNNTDSVRLYDNNLSYRIDIRPVFPNVDYGSGVFKILSNSKRSVFFSAEKITIHSKDYMEVQQTIVLQNRILNAFPAQNDKVLLLGSDSIFRLYDIAKQEYSGATFTLRAGDKFGLSVSHLVVLTGKKLKRYWLEDLSMDKSVDLAYTPGGFCMVNNMLYVVHSPTHLLRYPDIYKYDLNLNQIAKIQVPTYCIGLDNLFPYAANGDYLGFIFQGKLVIFGISNGQIVTPANKMNLIFGNSAAIELLPEFENGLPLFRYFRFGEWYYGISSVNFFWSVKGTSNRHSVCLGTI